MAKLTEKSLNSVGSSPVLNQLRSPEELKSNILKAQAEAALKVFNYFIGVILTIVSARTGGSLSSSKGGSLI